MVTVLYELRFHYECLTLARHDFERNTFRPFLYVKLGKLLYFFNPLCFEEVRSGSSFKVIIWIHTTTKFRIVFLKIF
jgi:hypothetical protein